MTSTARSTSGNRSTDTSSRGVSTAGGIGGRRAAQRRRNRSQTPETIEQRSREDRCRWRRFRRREARTSRQGRGGVDCCRGEGLERVMGWPEGEEGARTAMAAEMAGHVASVNHSFYPEDPPKPEFRRCSRTRKGCPRAATSRYPAKDPILMENFCIQGEH